MDGTSGTVGAGSDNAAGEVQRADDLNDDWHQIEAADRLLHEAQAAVARRDAEGARELLADAVRSLDMLGATDPDREVPRERRLGSRLLAVLRRLAQINDDELDAMIAEG